MCGVSLSAASSPASSPLRFSFYKGSFAIVKTHADQYPRTYKICGERVARMLEEAGFQGAKWTWKNGGDKIHSVSVVPPQGWDEGEWGYPQLSRVLTALKCDVCAGAISKRQCAACGKLLCRSCSYRCEGTLGRCAFAMCRADKEGPYKKDVPFFDTNDRYDELSKIGLCPQHVFVAEGVLNEYYGGDGY